MLQQVYDIETPVNLTAVGIKVRKEAPWILELTEPATEDQCAELSNRLRAADETCDYNGSGFDRPILGAVLDKAPPARIHEFGNSLISARKDGRNQWDVQRMFRHKPENLPNMIDLLVYVRESTEGDGSTKSSAGLKSIAGRLGLQVMEMPFDHRAPVTPDQMPLLREYLKSDLMVTEAVREALDDKIRVRAELEAVYGLPGLRAMTAAKLAATVITTEYCGASGVEIDEIKEAAGRNRNRPFTLQLPQWVLDGVRGTSAEAVAAKVNGAVFEVANGKRQDPDIEWPSELTLDEGALRLTFGLGGIHTQDSKFGEGYAAYDVSSMYPAILMRDQCTPAHLDQELFHLIYGAVLEERLKAKRAKQKLKADGLKLILNSTFGQMNSAYSLLYSPARFLNITVSGQLSLIALGDRIGAKHGV